MKILWTGNKTIEWHIFHLLSLTILQNGNTAVLFSIGSIERYYAFVPVLLTVLSYHLELCEHFNDITAELFPLYAIELFN